MFITEGHFEFCSQRLRELHQLGTVDNDALEMVSAVHRRQIIATQVRL